MISVELKPSVIISCLLFPTSEIPNLILLLPSCTLTPYSHPHPYRPPFSSLSTFILTLTTLTHTHTHTFTPC